MPATNWLFQTLTVLSLSQAALQKPLEQATCAPNEMMDPCGGHDTYCHVAPFQWGDPRCRAPACVCAQGHARERNGTCVRVQDCAPPCGPNEYLPRHCESSYTWGGTCEEPDVTQTMDCRWPPSKCLCIETYVRHNGSCIPQEACPGGAGGPSEIATGQNHLALLTPLL